MNKAVVLDVRGFSDFGALHSRKNDHEVQLYAFDLLALGGDDIRNCRCTCARPTSPGSWRADPRASSWRPSSRARSVRACSATPA
jgi:hypothetical protein